MSESMNLDECEVVTEEASENISLNVEETVFIKIEPEVNVIQDQNLESSLIAPDILGFFHCNHEQCLFSAKSRKDLKRHKESVHLEIPSGDIEVRIAAAKARGIEAAVGSDGRLYYHCNYCDYTSVRSDTIKSHIDRKHLALRPYPATKPHHVKDKKCDQCDYLTDQVKHLTRHKERVHGAIPSNEELEERIAKAASLEITAAKDTFDGHLIYYCNICEHRANNLSTAKSHRTRKHMAVEPEENWIKLEQDDEIWKCGNQIKTQPLAR